MAGSSHGLSNLTNWPVGSTRGPHPQQGWARWLTQGLRSSWPGPGGGQGWWCAESTAQGRGVDQEQGRPAGVKETVRIRLGRGKVKQETTSSSGDCVVTAAPRAIPKAADPRQPPHTPSLFSVSPSRAWAQAMPWEEGAWPRVLHPCQVGGVGMVQSAQVAGGGRHLAHSPSHGPDPLEAPSPGVGWWGPSQLPLWGLGPRDTLERVALAPTVYSVSLHGVSWPQSWALWPRTPGFWALGPLAWPSGCQNCLHHKEQLLPCASPPLGAGGCLGGPGSFPPRL